MKNFMLNILLAASAASFGGIMCATAASFIKYNDITPSEQVEEVYLEDNKPSDGMCFSSANVLEEYEYDDAYCLLYDDADANMYDVEIYVDLETYLLVRKAIAEERKLIGKLVLNKELSYDAVQVFTYMPDPEMEMADESADF